MYDVRSTMYERSKFEVRCICAISVIRGKQKKKTGFKLSVFIRAISVIRGR